MPRKAPAKKPKSQSKGVDLSRLSQSEAAWLVNKSTSHLRDNSHRFSRNSDGSYDGQQLIRSIQTDFQPAELAEIDMHHLVMMSDAIAVCMEGRQLSTIIGLLESIQSALGAAGLAAAASVILKQAREYNAEHPADPLPTPAEIRAEAESKISKLADRELESQFRYMRTCEFCQKIYWCGEWQTKEMPPGYVEDQEPLGCPTCEKAGKWKRR